jgi:hypothetical protein
MADSQTAAEAGGEQKGEENQTVLQFPFAFVAVINIVPVP